ncbi:extracellular solute-binding protein, partial [Agrobacterium cavarae]
MTIAKLMGAVALAALSTPAWAEQVQINLWTVDRPGEYHYKMAEEFSAKNPDIKVNVRSVQFPDMVNELAKAMATGEAPDVTYIDNPDVALFASRKLLLDMKPMIDKSSVI